MQLPPDDEGLDLGDAPPLPDEGQELPGLPDDDILGNLFGDHLADADWLERSLADIAWEDSNNCALIRILPADDVVWMDISEVVDAVPLPDSLARTTCACQQKCVESVMAVAELTVRHLRDEVRDKSLLLELVKHAHLATVSPTSRRGRSRMWNIAGHNVCIDAFTVLLGIGSKRLLKIVKSMRTSFICPCLLYTSPSPRDKRQSRMPSSA